MKKKTLTIALAIASIVVTCAQVCAEIRVEAVGVATTRLKTCPEKKALPCKQFFQYKVFSHFSRLTLGDARPAKKAPAPKNGNLIASPPQGATGTSPLAAQPANAPVAPKAWNRIRISIDSRNSPLDIFKSSSRPLATTGTVLTTLPECDLARKDKAPIVSVEGNTRNPKGIVVLCVDFIPRVPQPTGGLQLDKVHARNGEKVPMIWKINR